jgi:molecular chaperone DnaK
MCSDLVERTLKPCAQALEDAGYTASDIDEVILVGGQTRMPLVQKRVTEFFGREPSKEVNPDEVVAVGAALQGGAISGEVSEVLLLDVTPLSLGVETGGGVFTRIIMRNTTIPTERSEIFTTSVDNQPFVPIHVLQGEREMASDNKTLAKFELAPIPPAMRGVPMIEVKFNIDANGIVNVAAIDKGTGQEKTVRVVASGGLTPEQLQEVISEADENRDFDSKRKEIAEIRNAAQSLMYTSGRAVEECAELVSSEIIDEVKADIGRLQGHLDVESDADTLRDALQTLEMSAYRIAESMYSDAAGEAAASPEVDPSEATE